MPKKPKKQRVPRTRAGGTMTESQYWGFIRSGLRHKSNRWPPKYQVLKAASKPVKNKRHKTEYKCAACKNWFKQSEVMVDHIKPAGSLRSFEDLPAFVETLFCEPENLQVMCKDCHQKKTNEERNESRKT